MALWQKLLVELAEIKNSIFENMFETIIIKYDANGPSQKLLNSNKHQKKVKECNQYGYSAAAMYEQITDILMKEEEKPEESDSQYIQTICTAKFNVAKIYSRIILKDAEARLQALIKSKDNYAWIGAFLEKVTAVKGVDTKTFVEQKRLCDEMSKLLPDKIS